MARQELDDLCMGCMSVNKTGSVCKSCGFDNATPQSSLELPYRTILNKKFLIGRVLGKGGFGITYLAWDLVLQTAVAIKEYLPSTLVTRDSKRPIVVAHSADEQTEFEYGLKQFLQEARTLAQFSHANVVRVREFFPANKTAYLVMDYYKGVSLQQFLQLKNRKLTEQEALRIILPVLNGLAQVHQKGFLHRDIKPDNIYLVEKEHPVLLDFGAARSAFSQKSHTLSVILTPGFAPFEQYLSRSHFTPATDIYSVAATIYYMVSSIKPNEATSRLQNDPIIDLANLEPSVSSQFANSIMKALSVYPEQRPQSVEEFEHQLTEVPAIPSIVKPVYKKSNFDTIAQPLHQESPELGLAPIEDDMPREKKYETYYCPHCKTKNVVRDGKLMLETKCIKCRKTPSKELKMPLSLSILIKVCLALPLLLVTYHYVFKGIVVDSSVKGLIAPIYPETSVTTEPEGRPPKVGITPKQLTSPPSKNVVESSKPDNLTENFRLPKLAPQFAIEACENKSLHDECIVNTPRRKLHGVCEDIRGVLACIPGTPKFEDEAMHPSDDATGM